MYYNAKQLCLALLAKTHYERCLHLVHLRSARPFWSHYNDCMTKLLSATSRLVPEADKKSLRKGGPLDR